MTDVVFHFDLRRGIILTANQRLHWRERAARTQILRLNAAKLQQSTEHRHHFERAHCIYVLGFPDSRRRDPANWQPTVKALIDGLVSGPAHFNGFRWPLLPDDDWSHLTGPDPRISTSHCPIGHVWIDLIFTPIEEDK
jgi:hypothetical protein